MNDPMQSPPPGPPQAPAYQPPSDQQVPDYMIWAILSTVLGTLFTFLACCCIPLALPTGIVAIVQANKAKSMLAAARFEEAHKAAGQAKLWSIVTTVMGALALLWFGLSLMLNMAFSAADLTKMINV